MNKKALAWYFDFSTSSVRYAATLWNASYDLLNTGSYPPSKVNLAITLESTDTGEIDNTSLIDFIITESLENLSLATLDENCIVLESIPHQKLLERRLKEFLGTAKQLKVIEREDAIADQIIHYASLINVERYHVAESFLYCPDLIFDDFSDRNLIDPILTDEQNVFPLTESFLIGCHYWDKTFKSGGFCFTFVDRH